MRLNQIRLFLAVIEAGSIHAAARSLAISQPSVTKMLRTLEDELHVRLLERTRRGVVPTHAGMAFVARARNIQAELRRAEEEIRQIAGEREGSVSLGVSHVAIPILGQSIKRFQERFPTARVSIVERVWSTMLPMIRDGTLDFVVGRPPDGKLTPDMSARQLFQSKMVIVARVGHPRACAHSLAELLDDGWVTFVPADALSLLQRTFVAAKLAPPRTQVYCESISAAFALIADTDLLSMVPHSLVESHVPRGRVESLPIQERLPRQTMGLYLRKDTQLTPTAAALVQEISKSARQVAQHSTDT